MNNLTNTYQQSFDSTPVTHSLFGLMGGLTQQVGLFECDQFVFLDGYQQPNQMIELSPDQYRGVMDVYQTITIPEGQWLYMEAKIDENNHLLNWSFITLPFELGYASFIMQCAYQRGQVLVLFEQIHQLRSKALQSLLWSLLSQPEIAKRFVANPASRNHHHAFPGGLLEHSLECMQMVMGAMEPLKHLSTREKELTQVAALLHDIGKTQTLTPQGDLTAEGYNLNHEHYTLSVLADELKQLKRNHPNDAIALEYLLTWKLTDGYPKFIGANLIKLADRASTGMSMREKVFADLPAYFHFTKIPNSQIMFSRLS